MITPEQIRAARALLRIEQKDLARRAGIPVSTVRRIEAAGGTDVVARTTVDGVRRALEQAGAEFVENGVRRRTTAPHDAEARLAKLRAIAERSAAL
ncbi:MAG: helix-turn-helix domain-containing protein, partial [Alphaproteobacteria bacterium]|nr:helix-turn-helix domain-containing protein [Alphaproteobacteria bacterium]